MGTYVEITYTLPANPQSRVWLEWYPTGDASKGFIPLAAGAQFYGEHPTAIVTDLSLYAAE